MSVKHQNPEYTTMFDQWRRCRDCAAGQVVIHGAGTAYLPALSNQTESQYKSYLTRTPFYNATWRTIDGLRGMIFRKPPVIKASDKLKEMFKDITMTGKSLHMLASDVVKEDLTVGRCGLFVDYPITEGLTTLADVVNNNLRPVIKMYKAESIINWKMRSVNNVQTLAMVVLSECVPVPKDEFQDEYKDQYRVLDLVIDEITNKLIYRVRIFEINNKGEDVQIGPSVYPQIKGKNLDYIPFQFISTDDVCCDIDNPPLIDLVDMNISHYQTTADYEHGCHFTGLPTPYVTGYTIEKEGESFCIGSTTAWVFPNAQAKVGYLEFTGAGLESLKDNLAKKENYMAILGARMLEAQANAVEASTTAAIHRGGEQSTLASISIAVSIGLSKALSFFARFAGVDEDPIIELNKDFFPIPMDSLQITALVAAWQNSAISYETMFNNLKKGEIIDVAQTVEKELQSIKENPPPLPEVGTTPGSQSPNTRVGGKNDDKTATELQRGKV